MYRLFSQMYGQITPKPWRVQFKKRMRSQANENRYHNQLCQLTLNLKQYYSSWTSPFDSCFFRFRNVDVFSPAYYGSQKARCDYYYIRSIHSIISRKGVNLPDFRGEVPRWRRQEWQHLVNSGDGVLMRSPYRLAAVQRLGR